MQTPQTSSGPAASDDSRPQAPGYLTPLHTPSDEEAPRVETDGVALTPDAPAEPTAAPSPGAGAPERADGAQPVRKKAIGAGIWVLAGFGLSQVIRLAANIILARILFPDVFGTMAIVNVFMQGLAMFSDIGIGPSLVQSKRGEERDFLNTAWSIQIVRGLVLWAASIALAYPLAVYFGKSDFAKPDSFLYIIPAMGFTAVLSGFESTAIQRLYRHLKMGKLVGLELITQVFSVIIMIDWAVTFPPHTGAWAMVMGGLGRGVVRTAMSYLYMTDHKHRWCWNAQCRAELFKFGRWVFGSTLIAFLATRGDRLVLGRWLDLTHLGFYSIALGLASITEDVLDRVATRVLFPVFSRLQGQDASSMRGKLMKARGMLMLLFLPPLWFLAIFAHALIGRLYKPEYAAAGDMLQILSIGMIFGCINNTAAGIPLAMGDSFRPMIGVAWRSVMLYAAMFTGGMIGGERGLVIGVATVEMLCWPVNSWMLAKHRIWTPGIEIAAVLVSAAVIWAGIHFNIEAWAMPR